MEFMLNSGSGVDGNEGLAATAEEKTRHRLARFADRLTRVELYVNDRDGTNNGPDGIEVSLEARPAGDRPVAVSARAQTVDQAIDGALHKIVASLDSSFGKADRRR